MTVGPALDQPITNQIFVDFIIVPMEHYAVWINMLETEYGRRIRNRRRLDENFYFPQTNTGRGTGIVTQNYVNCIGVLINMATTGLPFEIAGSPAQSRIGMKNSHRA